MPMSRRNFAVSLSSFPRDTASHWLCDCYMHRGRERGGGREREGERGRERREEVRMAIMDV